MRYRAGLLLSLFVEACGWVEGVRGGVGISELTTFMG